MTTLARRVREISELEGFDVAVLDANGAPVPTNENGWRRFNYDRMARGTTTVAEWKANRFTAVYGPTYSCIVMNADGTEAHGNTRLSNVRATYEEGDGQPPPPPAPAAAPPGGNGPG